MSISSLDAIKLVRELRKFCRDTECSSCCFADTEDEHCLLMVTCPGEQDIRVFVQRVDG